MFLALCLCALVYPLAASAEGDGAVLRDPLDSSRWRYIVAEHFRDAPVVFDPRVQVRVADSAEQMGATPVQVSAPTLADVTQIRVIADASVPSRILDYFPVDAAPAIGFSFEVGEATPLRAAVRTADGVWHLGGRWVDAQGGGCAPPSMTRAVGDVEAPFGTIEARSWGRSNDVQRLKFRIVQSGPLEDRSNTAAPVLDEIVVRDTHKRVRARIVPGKTLARGLVFTLDMTGRQALTIEARDNRGGRYRANVAAAKGGS